MENKDLKSNLVIKENINGIIDASPIKIFKSIESFFEYADTIPDYCMSKNMDLKSFFEYKNYRNPLCEFLIYRIALYLELYEINDVDITDEVIDHLLKKFNSIDDTEAFSFRDEIEEKIETACIKDNLNIFKRRHILVKHNGKEFILETDTIISLMTPLGEILREINKILYGKKWYKETYLKAIQDKLGIKIDLTTKDAKKYRNYFWYLQLSDKNFFENEMNKKELSKDKVDEINELLNKLDKLKELGEFTYTFDNMGVVPYNFNSYRGLNLNDDYNESIEWLKNMNKEKVEKILKGKNFKDKYLKEYIYNNYIDSAEFVFKNRTKLFKNNFPNEKLNK